MNTSPDLFLGAVTDALEPVAQKKDLKVPTVTVDRSIKLQPNGNGRNLFSISNQSYVNQLDLPQLNFFGARARQPGKFNQVYQGGKPRVITHK